MKERGQDTGQKSAKQNTILVVGDWILDEYWFLVRHYSDLSSHSSHWHYRIASRADDEVRDLCGAGLIVRVLYELRQYTFTDTALNDLRQAIGALQPPSPGDSGNAASDEVTHIVERLKKVDEEKKPLSCNLQEIRCLNSAIQNRGDLQLLPDPEDPDKKSSQPLSKEYDIRGFGRWHRDDEDLIKHFIHARSQDERGGRVLRASSPVTMNPKCEKVVDIKLDNLYAEDDPAQQTTRVIRSYRYVREQFEQLHRIDWEQPQRGEAQDAAPPNLFATAVSQAGPLTVVVNDHKKGVVTPKRIKELAHSEQTKTAKWFVRTKDRSIRTDTKNELPEWLREIPAIELLMIGPEISCRAYPSQSLLTEGGELAKHTYDLISRLRAGKVKNLVVTSDQLQVVALMGDNCYVAKATESRTGPGGAANLEPPWMNWTTAFFAALVYEISGRDPGPGEDWNSDREICKRLIQKALETALDHTGVPLPDLRRPEAVAGPRFGCRGGPTDPRKPSLTSIEPHSLKDMTREWDQAKSLRGLGIIRPQGSGGAATEATAGPGAQSASPADSDQAKSLRGLGIIGPQGSGDATADSTAGPGAQSASPAGSGNPQANTATPATTT